MEEGTIVEYKVSVGDEVKKGDTFSRRDAELLIAWLVEKSKCAVRALTAGRHSFSI
jgi:hypothetical protein